MFEIVSKDPKEQHIPKDVHDAAVHKHGRDQREINWTWCGLQIDDPTLISNLNWDRPCYVLARSYLFWNSGKRVGELIVRAETLQEHEHQYVYSDEYVVNYWHCGAVAVIVADREDNFSPR